MDKKDGPAPGGGERRDRKAQPEPVPDRRARTGAVLGVVAAVGAVSAWLLRRERSRAPEGTWRDLLSSESTYRGRKR